MAKDPKANEPQQEPEPQHPEARPPAEPENVTQARRQARKDAAARPGPRTSLDGLGAGRIVHYVLPNGRRPGEHRAAMVIDVQDPEAGVVRLAVFSLPELDYAGADHPGLPWYAPSVKFDPTAEMQGTWHWIEGA